MNNKMKPLSYDGHRLYELDLIEDNKTPINPKDLPEHFPAGTRVDLDGLVYSNSVTFIRDVTPEELIEECKRVHMSSERMIPLTGNLLPLFKIVKTTYE